MLVNFKDVQFESALFNNFMRINSKQAIPTVFITDGKPFTNQIDTSMMFHTFLLEKNFQTTERDLATFKNQMAIILARQLYLKYH